MRLLFEVGLLLISYLFGCLNGAYYVGKVVKRQDVRDFGSSNAGARNAGRVFGRSAFVYTVIIDALKTIIPLVAASYLFSVSEIMMGGIALAVLLGHIWPVHLQFRGGKGVVVYLAAALVIAPFTLVVVGITLLVCLLIRKNFTVAGFIALVTIPIVLVITTDILLSALFFIMLFIVIIAHIRGS